MAIIKNVELYYCKLDPKRPNDKYNKKNPTWECQIRTTSKEVKKEWEALNLPVKAIVPDDDSAPYYRVNLKKKSIKEKENVPAQPVKVINGALEDINPNSIGNGSIGNVRIFQYSYPKDDGRNAVASILMGVQITKHVVYTPPPRSDEFEQTDTEVVDPDTADTDEEFV
jgi:hypothetical protein